MEKLKCDMKMAGFQMKLVGHWNVLPRRTTTQEDNWIREIISTHSVQFSYVGRGKKVETGDGELQFFVFFLFIYCGPLLSEELYYVCTMFH